MGRTSLRPFQWNATETLCSLCSNDWQFAETLTNWKKWSLLYSLQKALKSPPKSFRMDLCIHMCTPQPRERESKSCCWMLVIMRENGIWLALFSQNPMTRYLQLGAVSFSAEPRARKQMPGAGGGAVCHPTWAEPCSQQYASSLTLL